MLLTRGRLYNCENRTRGQSNGLSLSGCLLFSYLRGKKIVLFKLLLEASFSNAWAILLAQKFKTPLIEKILAK